MEGRAVYSLGSQHSRRDSWWQVEMMVGRGGREKNRKKGRREEGRKDRQTILHWP